MDKQGIPSTFKLFPGNTNDCLLIDRVSEKFINKISLGRVVVVADKGITTGENIHYTLSGKYGYVFSMSVRGANKAFKKYVLDEKGVYSMLKVILT